MFVLLVHLTESHRPHHDGTDGDDGGDGGEDHEANDLETVQQHVWIEYMLTRICLAKPAGSGLNAARGATSWGLKERLRDDKRRLTVYGWKTCSIVHGESLNAK